MNQQNIKLIVLDLDGTLLRNGKAIGQDDLDALMAAKRQGISIALCSGRASDNMSGLAKEYALGDVPILSLNGAYCVKKPFGESCAEHYFAPDALEKMLSVLTESFVTFGGFQRNTVFTIAKDGQYQKADSYWCVDGGKKHGLSSYRKAKDKRLNKIVVVDDDARVLSRVREKLEAIQGIDVSSSWINNLEIMPTGVDKGLAVTELSQTLGLTLDNVMALGDFDTDLSMIRCAGLGVAMGNGSEAVKAAAKVITDTNENGGVGKAIWRYALGREPIEGGYHEGKV